MYKSAEVQKLQGGATSQNSSTEPRASAAFRVSTYGIVSTFDVNIKTTFFREPQKHFDLQEAKTITTKLSLQLTCHANLLDTMMCHTEKYNEMQPLPSNVSSASGSTSRRIRPDSFDKPGIPFEVRFNSKGIVAYVIESSDMASMRMMNVYRMIANLMSFGIDIDNNDRHTTENSTVGYCPMNYIIMDHPLWVNSNLSLPLINIKFNNDKVMCISKKRNIKGCKWLSSYIFAARFWPEFVPASSVKEIIDNSLSLIVVSKSTFESMTENWFKFYDKNEKVVGSVSETVTLKLKSVHLDWRNQSVDENMDNIKIILGVINDNDI